MSDDALPQFEFDPTPRTSECQRCGTDGAECELRFVIVRGRTRYVGRTVCEVCAETTLEALVGE